MIAVGGGLSGSAVGSFQRQGAGFPEAAICGQKEFITQPTTNSRTPFDYHSSSVKPGHHKVRMVQVLNDIERVPAISSVNLRYFGCSVSIFIAFMVLIYLFQVSF